MQFGSPYLRWPVPRDWRSDPCQRAPASEACRNYTADLMLDSYGVAGLGQFFSENTGLTRAGLKPADWIRRRSSYGLGQPPEAPSFTTTLGVLALALGLIWLMKDPPKKPKRSGRLGKKARKRVRRRKRALAGYAAA